MKEKDLNLKLSLMLEELLKKNETVVFQIIDNDKSMKLLEERDLARNSKANIHISIDANSSVSENEFPGTAWTQPFSHNSFWGKLAEFVFDRMLELGLIPFCYVGTFNYRGTRMFEMPAIF